MRLSNCTSSKIPTRQSVAHNASVRPQESINFCCGVSCCSRHAYQYSHTRFISGHVDFSSQSGVSSRVTFNVCAVFNSFLTERHTDTMTINAAIPRKENMATSIGVNSSSVLLQNVAEDSGSTQRFGHVAERRAGLRADRANRSQAHNDDQGEHHGVFHRSSPIFGDQETSHFLNGWFYFNFLSPQYGQEFPQPPVMAAL